MTSWGGRPENREALVKPDVWSDGTNTQVSVSGAAHGCFPLTIRTTRTIFLVMFHSNTYCIGQTSAASTHIYYLNKYKAQSVVVRIPSEGFVVSFGPPLTWRTCVRFRWKTKLWLCTAGMRYSGFGDSHQPFGYIQGSTVSLQRTTTLL